MTNRFVRRILSAGFALSSFAGASLLSSTTAMATIVEFQTSHGNFQVNLYDQSTPITVANFLSYVETGAYEETIIHRVVPNFIVQGGGVKFDGEALVNINTNASIINEPVFSNIAGTIAMAKTNDPNSATSQWFFNTVNNSSSLDIKSNSGGFTVFGEIIENDMDYNDFINKVEESTLCNSTPVVNLENCSDSPGAENFFTIYNIVVIDPSATTSENLNPPKNTLVNSGGNSNDGDGGGGSIAWMSLLILASLSIRRKINIPK